jgi:hypothetical protein
MPQQDTDEKMIAPYIPWETFLDVIKHLRTHGVPERIDKTALPEGMPTLVRGQVQSALRFLGLTGENNLSNEALHALATAYETERWSEVLQNHVVPQYAAIVGDLKLASATQLQLDEKFEAVGIEGQMALKSIRFYLLLVSAAGIPYSPHLVARRKFPIKAVRKKATQPQSATAHNSDPTTSASVPTDNDAFERVPLGNGRFIGVPKDLTIDDCEMVEAMMPYLKRMAEKGAQQ